MARPLSFPSSPLMARQLTTPSTPMVRRTSASSGRGPVSNEDIDGFIFYHNISSASTEYTFTLPLRTLPSSFRQTVARHPERPAADLYHSFGIRAYRIVDPDVAAGGVIQTASSPRPLARSRIARARTSRSTAISLAPSMASMCHGHGRGSELQYIVTTVLARPLPPRPSLPMALHQSRRQPGWFRQPHLVWTWTGLKTTSTASSSTATLARSTSHTFNGATPSPFSTCLRTVAPRASSVSRQPATTPLAFVLTALSTRHCGGIIMSSLVKPTQRVSILTSRCRTLSLAATTLALAASPSAISSAAVADASNALALANDLDDKLAELRRRRRHHLH
jgi:hypothetical protein